MMEVGKKVSPARLLPLVSAVILLSLIACACQASSIVKGKDGGATSEVQLSFSVLGIFPSAQASTQSGPSLSRSISRLILNSATTLTVSLTPLDTGLGTPPPQTVAISSGATSITASFTEVEYGDYTVKAVAADASGNPEFQQSAALTVGEASTSVTLNLVPAIVDTTTITGTSYSFSSGSPLASMVAGDMRIYAVPTSMLSSGGTVPAAHYRLQVSYSFSIWPVYAVNSDGALLMSGATTASYGLTVSGGTSVFVPSNAAYVGPCSISSPSYLIFVYGGSSYPYINLSYN
jgi:hypothetical protein